MKRGEIKGFSLFWVAVAFFICLGVGVGIGMTLFFYFACLLSGVPFAMDKPADQMGINPILLWSFPFIGIWFGVLEITIPLFLLILKPFFIREAVENFKLSPKKEKAMAEKIKQLPAGEVFLVNKIWDYWLNLVYPRS